MRICSLLPSATEIAFALGLGDSVVAVTHECDYPPEAKTKRVVVKSVIDAHRHTSHQIDQVIAERVSAKKSIYTIDLPRLVDGLEILGLIIHPEIFSWQAAPEAAQRIG